MKTSNSIILISFLLLAFTTGDCKSEYILPPQASSVCASDINLDGSMDIIVGHIYSQLINWTGITMMINDGNGYLMQDTFYLNGQHRTVLVDKLNNNDEPDLVTQYYDGTISKIGILFDFLENQNNLYYINLTNYADYISKGDINGDGFVDIVFAFNVEKQFGVSYNSGTGNFSEPDYYETELYPNDLAVGDIDGNGRDDIAIAGSNTEIYYSFETGFELFNFTGYEHDVELTDMDKDGDLDIITLWGIINTTVIIYENFGYQNFQQHIIYMLSSISGGASTPDLNNDSLADVTFFAGNNFKFLLNVGQFSFTDPDSVVIPDYYQDYCWGNIDKNYFPDIIIIKSSDDYVPNLKILFNDGNGNFVDNPITTIENPILNNQNPKFNCFPNPFTTETTFEYTINKANQAELSVYDLQGKLIACLTNNDIQGGVHSLKWNGLDNGGKPSKPGPLVAYLKVGGKVRQSIKLIKLK
jgi:hypothetical protein